MDDIYIYFTVLQFVHLGLVFAVPSSDNKRVFHLDRWTSNTFQCGYQDSCWWASGSRVDLCLYMFLYSVLIMFYMFSCCDLSLVSYCTSQVNWQWLWVRWVVGNLLCCWRRWGRCSECRGQLRGTGQQRVHYFVSVWMKSYHTVKPLLNISYCGRMATILISWFPSQGSFPVTVLYFPNHFNQIASWMRVTLPGWFKD